VKIYGILIDSYNLNSCTQQQLYLQTVLINNIQNIHSALTISCLTRLVKYIELHSNRHYVDTLKHLVDFSKLLLYSSTNNTHFMPVFIEN